ncbi:MAG: cytochrome P450 [Deltaproteobacteria bacterium]|nr:cytochrome P450 [Deltaproteobacteria bacterium]
MSRPAYQSIADLPPLDPKDPFFGANPFDPSFRGDPHARLARLRAVAPVSELPFGVFRLARYADCQRLLRDVPTGVRNADGQIDGRERIPRALGPGEFMLQQDPPAHPRLRRLVSKAFTPRAIERLRAPVKRLVDELVERALAKGEMDVIADLALPVPSTVICEMMGVPIADRARFTEWTAQATHLLAAQFAPQEVIDRAAAAAEALEHYFEDLIAERRTSPREDILTELIRAEEAGDRLTPRELIAQASGLLIAGFETTIGLIGNGVRMLVLHPDQLARLRADPGLIASAVEECLRFDGPIPLTIRVTREETRFGDVVIPKDRRVMALLSAANRDPAKFPDPDRFDVGRSPNEHLAFGGGAHFCLGVHLARMEAQLAIGTLVARTRTLELDDSPPEWGASLFRVLGRLPLRLSA